MPLLSVYLLRSTGGVRMNKHCSEYQNSFLAASVSKFMQFKRWCAHPHVAVCPQKLDLCVTQEPWKLCSKNTDFRGREIGVEKVLKKNRATE